MSKRGRRRNSKRRKSSSSSKQSVTPYIFQKQNKSNSVSYKDDIVEKGETDCLRKENVLSGSEDEEAYNAAPPREKRLKHDYNVNSRPRQSSIYASTAEAEEKGVKIVTSVSVDDKLVFQQSNEPLDENSTHWSPPFTNVTRIDCSDSKVKVEIQHGTSGVRTTVVVMNEKADGAGTAFEGQHERRWTPNNEDATDRANAADRKLSLGGARDAPCEPSSASPTESWDDPSYCHCCGHRQQQVSSGFMSRDRPSSMSKAKPAGNRKHFYRSCSGDQFWEVPPPQEFADSKYETLEDLAHDLSSCRLHACSPNPDKTCNEESLSQFSLEVKEKEDLVPSFDQSSDSDNYEPMFMRPSLSTNRSSFTKEFINCQKRKSWIRNNSIATVERRPCSLPKKRRQTFPGPSQGPGFHDDLLPYSESFSSMIMCSLPLQTERLGRFCQRNDSFSVFGRKGSSRPEIPNSSHDRKPSLLRPLGVTCSEDHPEETFAVNEQSRRRSSGGSSRYHRNRYLRQDSDKSAGRADADACGDKAYQTEVADSGFDQDMGEVESHSPEPLADELSRRTLAIQVIPPSCSGSEEQIRQNYPVVLFKDNKAECANGEDLIPALAGIAGSLEPDLDTDSELGRCMETHPQTVPGDLCVSAEQGTGGCSLKVCQASKASQPPSDGTGHSGSPLPRATDGTDDLRTDTARCGAEDQPAGPASCPGADVHARQPASRPCLDGKEHLRPPAHRDPDGGGVDSWAKRRKLFKDSKQWSSAGGSSITSDITEESVSEDTRSMDVTTGDGEERGFYAETFHSAAWIYLGDDGDSVAIPPSLNTRTRAVCIRERTVRISKGTGEYPWGFRIQYSKPIVVTEVDTNGAAEEAGLLVGDYVLAVNGTDVTSIPHSEAADLARQGPDVLAMTIGSDIARGPNTPRPSCRGYLHKRTQSGLIKGWRKRWFVLTHDSCLYYYRHKRDEDRRRALATLRLEGAEVGMDISLGKPFVLKCRPLSGTRVYYFCATSNQEIKRWLEALERAVNPITQNHVWVDVTRHNSGLPPLAVKSPESLGLLHKMDRNKDMWVQHYCILKDGCLYLYSGIRATHAHGGIYLQGYLVREQSFGGRKSTIELKPPSDEFKTFYLCAENPNENKRWIIAIRASIKKWLPLHQALQDYMSRPPEETRM